MKVDVVGPLAVRLAGQAFDRTRPALAFPPEALDGLPLSSTDVKLLGHVDGRRTIGALAGLCGVPQWAVQDSLERFAQLGLVRL